MDCIFCKIIGGKIPAHRVHEDDTTLAFLDVKPHALGHTVVIPKKHKVVAADLHKEEYNSLMGAVRKVMATLKGKLSPDGFNVGWNDGSAAGQVVPHIHIHILPRYNGDGGGSQHSIINNPGSESVEEVAERLQHGK